MTIESDWLAAAQAAEAKAGITTPAPATLSGYIDRTMLALEHLAKMRPMPVGQVREGGYTGRAKNKALLFRVVTAMELNTLPAQIMARIASLP